MEIIVLIAIGFFIFKRKTKKKKPVNSKDWLTRAQAKQNIRIENSLPPLRAETKPQKQNLREK